MLFTRMAELYSLTANLFVLNQVCGHVFARKDNLKDHLRNHFVKGLGKTVYKCETCGKDFKGKSALVIHTRTHTG